MSDGLFPSFDTGEFEVDGASIHARIGGCGEPLLLLHGYPQTHAMWHVLAPQLAESYRVVVPDLRGYGDSRCHDADFSFRAMARDQVDLMDQLGHAGFHIVSHDRGARTAHRMALDHPGVVKSVTLLDILPTLDVWRHMDAWLAKRYFHWTFLSQPGEMPSRLIKSEPVMFLHATLFGLSGDLGVFAPDALSEYERAARKPSVVDAWCGDYAASASIDLDHDRESLGQTNEIPCLVMWGSRGVVAHHADPVESWQSWFPNASGQAIDAGHFLVEERPDEVLEAVKSHLASATREP